VKNKSHLFRALLGVAAFSLGLAACHGGSSGTSSYVPASSDVAAPQGSGVALDNVVPDRKTSQPIFSSCGDHVRIIVLGTVGCKFRERGYGNGELRIHNDTNGIVLVSPSSGKSGTTFTITGAVKGGGHFMVVSKYRSYEVHVTVSS
jgi:hypothetical protein